MDEICNYGLSLDFNPLTEGLKILSPQDGITNPD
jgi:hypothetical protein